MKTLVSKKVYENTEVMPHNTQVNIVMADQFHLLITLTDHRSVLVFMCNSKNQCHGAKWHSRLLEGESSEGYDVIIELKGE
jgi:hypothetical protein